MSCIIIYWKSIDKTQSKAYTYARINYNHYVRFFIDSGILANTSSHTTQTLTWDKASVEWKKVPPPSEEQSFYEVNIAARFGAAVSYFLQADTFSDNRNIGKVFFYFSTLLSQYFNNRMQYFEIYFPLDKMTCCCLPHFQALSAVVIAKS